MQKINDLKEAGNVLHTWEIEEYEEYERSKMWYIIAISTALVLMLSAFFTANFLLAVIIIITSLVVFLRHGQAPDLVNFHITDEGAVIGKIFYDYDEIKDFSIVYKPSHDVRQLYFEFNSALKHRLSIPLKNNDPLPIRENLLKYLPEDLERTERPFSEELSRLLRL